MALVLPQLNGEDFITANIGIALGMFLGGGLLTGQLSHLTGPRKRWWLVLCNLIQSGLVFGAGAIQYQHGVQLQGSKALAVVGMLALASGSQVVQSRSLAMTEISTAMATAAWIDLLIDPKVLVIKNKSRTRRVAFLVALVLGAFVGAFIYRGAGSAAAITVSAAGKLLVTVMYAFAGCEREKERNEGSAA